MIGGASPSVSICRAIRDCMLQIWKVQLASMWPRPNRHDLWTWSLYILPRWDFKSFGLLSLLEIFVSWYFHAPHTVFLGSWSELVPFRMKCDMQLLNPYIRMEFPYKKLDVFIPRLTTTITRNSHKGNTKQMFFGFWDCVCVYTHMLWYGTGRKESN